MSTIDFSKLEIKPLKLTQLLSLASLAKKIYTNSKNDPDKVFKIEKFDKESKEVIMKLIIEGIIDEFDVVNEQFGAIGKQVILILSRITDLSENQIKNLDFEDINAVMGKVVGKQEEEVEDLFLNKTDTTSET